MSRRAARASRAQGGLQHWERFAVGCLSPTVLPRTVPAAGTGLRSGRDAPACVSGGPEELPWNSTRCCGLTLGLFEKCWKPVQPCAVML